MRCIYCSQDRPADAFNREHVLPEAFGRFRNGLVLHEAVCEECNTFYGEDLDLVLARSSSEGLERYSWHLKPPEAEDQFRYGDVLIHLKATGTGWDNALVRKVPTEVPGESRLELIPQAVFKKEDGKGSVHVPLWELRKGAWRADASLNVKDGIRVLAPADLFDEVVAVLAEHGVDFTKLQELPAPQAEDGAFTVQHAFALTESLQRAVAKIAFNYFAYTNGTQAALMSAFDAVRRFVRYGEQGTHPFVAVVPNTRLGFAREDGQVPVVHYITVERDDTETALIAHLTLLHWAVYQVVLAEVIPPGLELKVSGHLFNVDDMSCHEMTRRARST